MVGRQDGNTKEERKKDERKDSRKLGMKKKEERKDVYKGRKAEGW